MSPHVHDYKDSSHDLTIRPASYICIKYLNKCKYVTFSKPNFTDIFGKIIKILKKVIVNARSFDGPEPDLDRKGR